MPIVCLLKAQMLKLLPVGVARRSVIKQSPIAVDIAQVKRKIFVDVSVFAVHDAGTGIQRVVREILAQLIKNPRDLYTVIPVAASKQQDYKTTAVALEATVDLPFMIGQIISPVKGDIFLGLDLAAHLLPHRYTELLAWKNAGVSIQMVVYDLLPALRPDWFKPKAVKNFNAWLKTLAVFSDRFHCISNTVKIDLMQWFQAEYGITLSDENVCVFPLGSNLSTTQLASKLTMPITTLHSKALAFMQQQPTTLMVGTVEPRKGHAEVLAAFTELWRQGSEHQLMVVGAPGWKSDAIQKVLATASEVTAGPSQLNSLMWLQDADDNVLIQLYRSATGVIVASKGEGYGLPLIEAAFFNKPVLARDIPVFREVAIGRVTFFSASNRTDLTPQALQTWLKLCTTELEKPCNLELPDWASSTTVLLRNMGILSTLKTNMKP
jgi:glycosyltransferase involved in cell wall biosynthesis